MTIGTEPLRDTPKKKGTGQKTAESKLSTKSNSGAQPRVQSATRGSGKASKKTAEPSLKDDKHLSTAKKQHTASMRSIDDAKKSKENRRSSDDLFQNSSTKKVIKRPSSTANQSSSKFTADSKPIVSSQGGNLPPKLAVSAKPNTSSIPSFKAEPSSSSKNTPKLKPHTSESSTKIAAGPTVTQPTSKVDSGSKAAGNTVASRLNMMKQIASQDSSAKVSAKGNLGTPSSISHKKPKGYEFTPLFK